MVADIIEEIMHNRLEEQEQSISACLHLVNPHTSTWQDLLHSIQSKYNLTIVDFTEWIQELELIKNPTMQDMQSKPGLKLLRFYRDLINADGTSSQIDVSKAKRASTTLTALQPVSADMMENWLRQWEELGKDCDQSRINADGLS